MAEGLRGPTAPIACPSDRRDRPACSWSLACRYCSFSSLLLVLTLSPFSSLSANLTATLHFVRTPLGLMSRDNWIRRGEHFPSGSPKSWMSQLYIGVNTACVSSGSPLPDGTPTQRGYVLLLAPYDSPTDILKARF